MAGELLSDGLYRVATKRFVAGFVVDGCVIIRCAPILRRNLFTKWIYIAEKVDVMAQAKAKTKAPTKAPAKKATKKATKTTPKPNERLAADGIPAIPISKSVRFVQGAIDAGQFVPVLKNYAIEDGFIQGSDGVITLNAAISLDYNMRVDAVKFARAIATCDPEEAIDLSLTDSGHLRVKQGTMRVIVPALADNEGDAFPWATPDGESYKLPENFLEQCEHLRPFIGTDATRPWALGIRVHQGALYTTNNVILVHAKLSDDSLDTIENVIIPARAIDELLRLRSSLNARPHYMLVSVNAVTFLYTRTWWLRSTLMHGDWPDTDKLFANVKGVKGTRVNDDFKAALKRLERFAPDASPVFIIDGQLSTTQNPEAEGAVIEGFEYANCAFMAGMLKLVLSEATHIGIGNYPKPMPFIGAAVRGIVAAYTMQSSGPEPTQPQRPTTTRWTGEKK